MSGQVEKQISGGEAILRALKANGIDRLFINPGSDFAPIIEAFAAVGSDEIPEAVPVAHEHAAVTMAHGYYLATGQMQAVAVHVNVGLANASMGLLNAHSDDVPIFMLSGRNPLTEGDRLGSRRTPIQYGQEMFDQSALVREAVKWDYELRYAEQAASLVDRGCAVARMEPAGAVYLSLPREPLCEVTSWQGTQSQNAPTGMFPDPAAIQNAAAQLANAENPLIICSRGIQQAMWDAWFNKSLRKTLLRLVRCSLLVTSSQVTAPTVLVVILLPICPMLTWCWWWMHLWHGLRQRPNPRQMLM